LLARSTSQQQRQHNQNIGQYIKAAQNVMRRAGLPTRIPAPGPRRVNASSMEPPSPILLVNIAQFAKYCSMAFVIEKRK
jgi:hypothetical protein